MEQERNTLIPLDALNVPHEALRSHIAPESIEELARSIAELGQLTPLIVIPEGASYEIIAGHRRYLALKWLGKTHAMCFVTTRPPDQAALIRLTENIQRQDLNPVEEARAVVALQNTHGLSVADIARRCGKSDAWARIRLQIIAWPLDIVTELAHERIGIGVAGHLAAISDENERRRLTAYAIESGANARVVMAWRAAWEATQTTVDTNTAQPAEHTNNDAPLEFMIPCWGCNAPIKIHEIHILRLCSGCIIDLNTAKRSSQRATAS